jgi:adenylylsulfate reductase subunit A
MVTHLLMDNSKANRVGGAVGFNVRTGDFYVFRAKAVIVAAGGASHIFKPRAVGEGMGRTWYAPWSSGSAYALPIQVGAKMTQMENRIVLTRFKDGYGPVGAYFLHLKTYTQNGYGEEYESKWYDHTKALVGDYIDRHPVPTCLRNHAFIEEMKAGRGPIRMVTKEAFQDPHKETVGWENFLGMTIGQAVVWASQNIDPKHINPELTTSEPYVMGSHATCSGAWASGPEDYAPAEYQWGYNRMMTVDGLFGAGDTIGGTAHKFSSGSFTEGRIAAKAAVKYVNDMGRDRPQVSEQEYQDLEKSIYQPMENYRVGRNEIVAGTVSPSYLLPIHGLQRLEKIMDEYVGGTSTNYMTNGVMLNRGLEMLAMLKEDMSHIGAEDLHQLQRTWELHHRLLASESVTHHTLFREETRWPGYYYRGDHMKLDDDKWHCFTLSRYDRNTGKWDMEKAPVYHIID